MPRMRPAWTASLGVMIAEDVEVSVWCERCGQWRHDIDLAALAKIKGDDYDLWGRRTRCRLTPGCEGWNTFLYLNRGGTFRRHMRD